MSSKKSLIDTPDFSLRLSQVYFGKKDPITTGQELRKITRKVEKKFQSHPGRLREYLEVPEMTRTQLSAGLVSGVYAMITGDFSLVERENFGGLGIILFDTPQDLVGKKNQFHHAFAGDMAFWRARGLDNSFLHTLGSGEAFREATGEDSSFRQPYGLGYAFLGIKGFDKSFSRVDAAESSFWGAEGYGKSFFRARGSGDSFADAKKMSENAFYGSDVLGRKLPDSADEDDDGNTGKDHILVTG